jgi:hypothetical protein
VYKKLPLKRNDGNDAACGYAVLLQKKQYFYWCFPLLKAKIDLDKKHPNEACVLIHQKRGKMD